MTAPVGGRTVVANISLSLDGRTAGPGGAYDMSWIVPHAVTDGSRADDESADPRDRAFSRWLDDVEKVVFSTTLTATDWRHARLASSDPATTVRQLRREGGGDVAVLASSSVIRALLAAGEVDRLSIVLCPEIAGGGARLLDDGLPGSSWRLLDAAPTGSGAICLRYDAVRR